MVLSINGLGSQMALNLIDRTKDRQMETLKSEALHQNAAEDFKERIASITTPEEFVKDYEVYSFVMRAFDLEDQIFGKAMMRKILESDPADDESLVNKLSNASFSELHEAMGFVTDEGVQVPDFSDADWQQGIIDKYYETVFLNENADQNETVGIALEFEAKVADLDSWYDVLADEEMGEFFRTVLGLPEEMAALDLDVQVRMLDKKFDLTKLQDADEVEQLVTRYVAIADALNPPSFTTDNAAVTMLSATVSGSYLSATIDIPTITYNASSLYK
jgi:hypothetical protein